MKNILFPLIIFSAGLIMFIYFFMGGDFGSIPGDIIDARFNNYIMEHGFRCINNKEFPFWNAPFFYPAQNVVAHSDNHLGNLPVYAAFRFCGASREMAFQLWILTQLILSYTASFAVLKLFKFTSLSSSAGAFFFTFGMPMLAQLGHAQLLPRFMIPVILGSIYFFVKERKIIYFIIICTAILSLFYFSIYLATLTILTGGMLCIGCLWSEREKLRTVKMPSRITLLLYLLFSCLTVLPVFHLLTHYNEAWEMLKYNCDLINIHPTLKSWFLPDHGSLLWYWLYDIINIRDFKHEHSMFCGIIAVTAIAYAGWLLYRMIIQNGKQEEYSQKEKIVFSFFVSFVLVFIFTLQVSDQFSILIFLRKLIIPLKSIRVTTRIILILMFPVAIFITYIIDSLQNAEHIALKWKKIIIALFITLLILENVPFYKHTSYRKAEAEERLQPLKNRLLACNKDKNIFLYVNPAEAPAAFNLDAMFVAQDLDMITMNGYSGHTPPRWFPKHMADSSNIEKQVIYWLWWSGIIYSSEDPKAPWTGKNLLVIYPDKVIMVDPRKYLPQKEQL